MRNFFLILLYFIFINLQAQQSYYDVYNDIVKTYEVFLTESKKISERTDKDSLQKMELDEDNINKYFNEMGRLSRGVINTWFPDINFSDRNEKYYMISDFPGELVINYNYPYCMSCISRIDSTQKLTDKKNIKILVLFSEIYKHDVDFLKMFNENVMIGFISDDTRKLISLMQGDDCMYYLDKDHRIEFFDGRNHKAWAKFLEKKML